MSQKVEEQHQQRLQLAFWSFGGVRSCLQRSSFLILVLRNIYFSLSVPEMFFLFWVFRGTKRLEITGVPTKKPNENYKL